MAKQWAIRLDYPPRFLFLGRRPQKTISKCCSKSQQPLKKYTNWLVLVNSLIAWHHNWLNLFFSSIATVYRLTRGGIFFFLYVKSHLICDFHRSVSYNRNEMFRYTELILTRFQGWEWGHEESEVWRVLNNCERRLGIQSYFCLRTEHPHSWFFMQKKSHTHWEVKAKNTPCWMFSEPRRWPVSIYPLRFLIWWKINAHSSKCKKNKLLREAYLHKPESFKTQIQSHHTKKCPEIRLMYWLCETLYRQKFSFGWDFIRRKWI